MKLQRYELRCKLNPASHSVPLSLSLPLTPSTWLAHSITNELPTPAHKGLKADCLQLKTIKLRARQLVNPYQCALTHFEVNPSKEQQEQQQQISCLTTTQSKLQSECQRWMEGTCNYSYSRFIINPSHSSSWLINYISFNPTAFAQPNVITIRLLLALSPQPIGRPASQPARQPQ